MLRGLACFLMMLMLSGCLVDGRCVTSADCGSGQVCNADGKCEDVFIECPGCPYPDAPHGTADCVDGECVLLSCDGGWSDADQDASNGCECTITLDGNEACDSVDNDCDGYVDEGCDCTPTNGGVEICDGKDNNCNGKVDENLTCCPDDMAVIDNLFCMDIYEASRPDATAEDAGSDESRPVSAPGVMPWRLTDQARAQELCESVNKRLCNPGEWLMACQGPQELTYCYGDEYDPVICNGIDSFCEVPEYKCGLEERNYRLAPTAAFKDCTNEYGIYDINGNLWEWDSGDEGARGGAYNCSDSAYLHRCTTRKANAATDPSGKIGFRCCK